MLKKSTCIKIPKINGEKTITLVNRMGIINKTLEIGRSENFLYIPLIRKPSKRETAKLREQTSGLTVSTYSFREKKRAKTFAELLGDKLSPNLIAGLPRSLDFVGDIVIVEISPELEPYERIVGEAILQSHKTVKTVLAKAGTVSGTYRLRKLEIIAGEPRTETVHKEYGCQYYVDVAKAYFSPRLSHEHKRVASSVTNGETIIDMFAGIGPFAILTAKTHQNIKVYAIDMNPDAVEFLKRNIRLNRVEDRVHPILGDAKQVIEERFLGIADRVIMNLPEKALDFLGAACKAIKSTGGVVHFYTFVNASDSSENLKKRFTDAVEKSGRNVEQILNSRLVRATAPYEWQVVLDARIR